MQNNSHQEAFQALNDAINKAVIGQEHVVRTLLLALQVTDPSSAQST